MYKTNKIKFSLFLKFIFSAHVEAREVPKQLDKYKCSNNSSSCFIAQPTLQK